MTSDRSDDVDPDSFGSAPIYTSTRAPHVVADDGVENHPVIPRTRTPE